MSTNLEYIEQEKDREKEKVGGRPANLNEKKGNRDLEREIKNNGDSFFVGKTTWKFCSGGEKMRNASGHQGENERRWKKSEQEHVRHFLHKSCNEEVSGSFTLYFVVMQNNGKEIYKKSVLHVQIFFFAN